ncbi:MAG: hypothetical protein Q9179_000178 [Wetmoreana sp. 5 TL-2023]
MATTTGAFIAGGIAACGAVTVTHPFETVKIRYEEMGTGITAKLVAETVTVIGYNYRVNYSRSKKRHDYTEEFSMASASSSRMKDRRACSVV